MNNQSFIEDGRRFPIISVLLLLTLTFSGCFSNGEADMGLPSKGSEYRYVADDGSELIATIKGVDERYDSLMRAHNSLIIDYVLKPANTDPPMEDGNGSFYFQEAIDRSEHRIVQQFADCGFRSGIPGSQDNVLKCFRRANVMFDATGLPGALGASALWRDPVKEDKHLVETMHLTGYQEGLMYNVSSVETEWGDCKRLNLNEGLDRFFRGLPWTVLTGPFTVCPGIDLPVDFVTEVPLGDVAEDYQRQRIAFTLADLQQGDEPLPPYTGSAASVWEDVEPLAPLHRWDAPYPLDAPQPDWPFLPQEAHDAGMEQSEIYQSLFEGDRDPVFTRDSFAYRGGGDNLALGEESRYERRFVLVDHEGERYLFRFIKTIQKGGLLQNDSSEVTLEEEQELGQGSVHPTSESYPDEMMSPKDAFELAWDLSQPDIPEEQKFMGPSSIYNNPLGVGWWSVVGQPPQREDGLELVIRFQSEQVGSAIISHDTRFDGPTGSLIHLARYSDDPPFGP